MDRIVYTIRNIPLTVDKVIREHSKQNGKTLNQTVIDLLTLQTLGTTDPVVDDNFDWLFGIHTLDQSFYGAIEELSKIDETIR